MRLARLAPLAAVLVACRGDDGGPPRPPPPAYLLDAAPAPSDLPPEPPLPSDDAGTAFPQFDPASGYHLDDDEGSSITRQPNWVATRDRRMLALLLKSSPSGAIAAVDGKMVGRTPVYWEGPFTGREREFTFVLPGYSIARYRFVPTRDGFVHGRLVKVSDENDGGVPAIPPPIPVPAQDAERRRPAPPAPTQPRPIPALDAAPMTPLSPDAAPAAPPDTPDAAPPPHEPAKAP